MISSSDLWPPFGLVVTAGDLSLSPVTDDDLPALAQLTLDGIHAPDFMPFSEPWTKAPADELPRRLAAYYWGCRATSTPEHLDLNLAVRRDGEIVGIQGLHLHRFAVTRTAETGSWLGLRFQGRGIGTRMRYVVCVLLIDHLGATEVTSSAFLDNPASLTVSRKLGYRENGTVRMQRDGSLALNRKLALDPADLVRGEPVQVVGDQPLRRFLLGD